LVKDCVAFEVFGKNEISLFIERNLGEG